MREVSPEEKMNILRQRRLAGHAIADEQDASEPEE